MANVYIRGGTRTEEAKGNHIRRPRIGRKSIEDLVKRNMESILKTHSQTLAEEDKLAASFRGTNIAPESGADNFPVSKQIAASPITLADCQYLTWANN